MPAIRYKLFLIFLFRFVENAHIFSVKRFDMNTMETNEQLVDINSLENGRFVK